MLNLVRIAAVSAALSGFVLGKFGIHWDAGSLVYVLAGILSIWCAVARAATAIRAIKPIEGRGE